MKDKATIKFASIFSCKPTLWLQFFLIIIIFAVALVLRLHGLDAESLFMDEARQVSYYQEDLGRIVQLAASQGQPPLDYWIGHLVAKFSSSDFAVRLPAAIFGSSSIILLYLLAAKFCVWPLAFGTAIVAALLPFNLYFSQEARPYAIAIFFLLAMLLALDSFLTTRRKGILSALFFFLASLGFLYSRTLSPLVTVVVLLGILSGHYAIYHIKQKLSDASGSKRLLASIGLLVFAGALYLPVLPEIMASGSRYLQGNVTFLGHLQHLIRNFDLSEAWKAFAVQTEPITLPVILLLLLAPLLTFRPSAKPHAILWVYILLLLPGTILLNIVIFQAKSSMPFRPPYAIYILPLTLLLAAGTIQYIWNLQIGDRVIGLVFKAFILTGCLLLITGTVQGAISYKTLERKTDWRGLGEYLEVFDNRQIIIFHNVSLYGYGSIIRYYKGKAPAEDIRHIFLDSSYKIENPKAEPIIVFFQAKAYYLTDQSRYPFMQATSQIISEKGIRQIVQEPALSLLRFKNLYVIRLRYPSGSLAMDTLTLLDNILPIMEQESMLFDLFLVQAILARFTGRNDWQKSYEIAEALAPANIVESVRIIGSRLRNTP